MESPMETLFERAVHTTKVLLNPHLTRTEAIKFTTLYVTFELFKAEENIRDKIMTRICSELNTLEKIVSFRDEIKDL